MFLRKNDGSTSCGAGELRFDHKRASVPGCVTWSKYLTLSDPICASANW